jgi:hypothetical protein
MKPPNEVDVSTDVETDGPIPGPHSMLSFASAAYRSDKTLVGTLSANLEKLPGASGHPETMARWKERSAAWQACRSDLEPPETVLPRYVAWRWGGNGPAGMDLRGNGPTGMRANGPANGPEPG